ncbi:LssY C-terminal domain-containing protein [Gulosibacter chungangensis]|uniref:LssY C-terminal domain-containing protein n=1 Tax=Gulosibacter chungangensis TaxID=979746 RepID=UPI001CE40881|nr:LssY C-terminal domain-containing protein [Gulosibacter chungangensis]
MLKLRVRKFVDATAFVVAGVAAAWYAVVSVTEAIHLRWWLIPLGILFWAALAYLVLPRLNRILTAIYVPGYFIGRTVTSHGLLGDPVNLAIMGDEEDIVRAMTDAGWTTADPVTWRSSWQIVLATITRRSYSHAPVSPLFLFERKQDLAFEQEVAGNPAQRHHIRFWKCPPGWPLPGGKRVDWLAAATFDRRVGLSLFTLQVTHKVASDADDERDHVVDTLRPLSGVTVEVLQDYLTAYRARNGGGDSFYTDGALPMVDLRGVCDAEPADPQPPQAQSPRAQPSRVQPSRVQPAHASESASVGQTEHEPAEDAIDKDLRPAPRPETLAGVTLVVLRMLVGAIWLIVFLGEGAEAAYRFSWIFEGLDPDEIAASTAVIAWSVAALLLVEALLAALMWRGSEFARMLLMLVSTAWILLAFASWLSHGGALGVHFTLVTVGFDLLLLLALSSREAAAYTTEVRQWREARISRSAGSLGR